MMVMIIPFLLHAMADDDGKIDHYEGYKFDEDRIAKLFNDLDVNQDGRIDVKELSNGLKRMGIKHIPGQAEVMYQIGLLKNHRCLKMGLTTERAKGQAIRSNLLSTL